MCVVLNVDTSPSAGHRLSEQGMEWLWNQHCLPPVSAFNSTGVGLEHHILYDNYIIIILLNAYYIILQGKFNLMFYRFNNNL